MTPVRSIEKEMTFLSAETKKIANLKYKKGHNSCKTCRKIVIIELTLDTLTYRT